MNEPSQFLYISITTAFILILAFFAGLAIRNTYLLESKSKRLWFVISVIGGAGLLVLMYCYTTYL